MLICYCYFYDYSKKGVNLWVFLLRHFRNKNGRCQMNDFVVVIFVWKRVQDVERNSKCCLTDFTMSNSSLINNLDRIDFGLRAKTPIPLSMNESWSMAIVK